MFISLPEHPLIPVIYFFTTQKMCIHIFMNIWSLAQKWKAAHYSRCNKSSSQYNWQRWCAQTHRIATSSKTLGKHSSTAKENEAMVTWHRKPCLRICTCDMKSSNSARQNCRLMQIGSHLVQVPAPNRASYNSWSSPLSTLHWTHSSISVSISLVQPKRNTALQGRFQNVE